MKKIFAALIMAFGLWAPLWSDMTLPTAEEFILRDLIQKYKANLSRFGFFVYKNNTWEKLSKVDSPKVVLLLHGLDEVGTIWDDMAPALVEKGHVVLSFQYPNDQGIECSAKLFREQLQWLHSQGIQSVYLIAHSMGGLISRDALTRGNTHDGGLPVVEHLVTIGTPNHGSPLAPLRYLGECREHLVRLVKGEEGGLDPFLDGMGEAAIDLKPNSSYLLELNSRPLPKVPITIIAGLTDKLAEEGAQNYWDSVKSDVNVFAPLIESTMSTWKNLSNRVGDGVVPLESTKLDGVDDWHVVQGTHHTMLKNIRNSPAKPPAVELVLDMISESSQHEVP